MIAFLIHIALWPSCAWACPDCSDCIPIEDLLSPGYGIEIAADGLSTAVAFHNGIMDHIHSNSGSPEYQITMQTIVDKYIGQSPQYHGAYCWSTRQPPPPSPSLFHNLLRYFITLWKGKNEQPTAPTPVHPNVQLFQAEIEALPPFDTMSIDERSRASIALTLPGWLTGAEEFCQMVEAAQRIFGRAFAADHSSAVYTALGYDLCRTPTDAADLRGPGRITTVDVQHDNLVSITLSQTPMRSWMHLEVISAVSRNMTLSELVEWIDSFVSSERSDLVVATGPGASEPAFSKRFIEQAKAGSLLINQPTVPASQLTALGAAQFAKDSLERRFDGCFEPERCEDIRREADRIAGRFKPPLIPSAWPLGRGRHEYKHSEL